ncbi:glycoside hydrolase family 66 protein [Anaeromyxobacter sp. Fw109-5]|uniref:glycoside hydrolase family 66 protein n=1 Tax=Anaeromyxobacter sp. (strain Fw109-5) TaxID=404589 RepID=UPI0002DCD21F|nr:glycoside hydrolase family 66 protein [Anaeromyxobacter sp. Fw109-5]
MPLPVAVVVVVALVGCAARAAAAPVIDLLPDKARYAPGEEVTLTARVQAGTEGEFVGPVAMSVYHLDAVVHADRQEVRVAPGATGDVTFRWTPPTEDFSGYLAVADAAGTAATTAVDVSSSPFRYPRYGYVSEFDPALSPQERERRVERLSREFLVNVYQLYDWGWRHEKLVETGPDGQIVPTWTDLFGRPVAWTAITGYVDAIHRYGAAAMGYVMVYAAREGYAERWPISPAWGLFAREGAQDQLHVQFPNDVFLWLFDPMNPGWQSWEIAQYVEAVRLAGLDGVHIDQLGPRFDVHLADGTSVDLAARFAPFLEATKRHLMQGQPDRSACTFNLVDGAVDGWATREVATSYPCDFLFSEIWFEADSYDDLRRYAEYLRGLSGGRAAVFAAYAQYGEEVGPIHEAEAARLHGVRVASDHLGYTGTGFVAALEMAGAAITWSIELSEPQNVSLVFRFANASGQVARRQVSVDGAPVGEVSFPSTAEWSGWSSDAYVPTTLGAGRHEISLSVRPGDAGAVNVDHLALGRFDEQAFQLADAVMFASGVTHIEIGDDVAGLAHEYYPNLSKSITPELQRAMRRYYTFSAAYENLLFAPEVTPVDPATAPLELLSGQPLGTQGANVIHPIFRRAPDAEIVHLVNLMGVDDDRWRNVAPPPQPQTDLRIRYRLPAGSRAIGVFVASPDLQGGRPMPLPYTTSEDTSGAFVEATIPRLEYWNMVVIRTAPVGEQPSPPP